MTFFKSHNPTKLIEVDRYVLRIWREGRGGATSQIWPRRELRRESNSPYRSLTTKLTLARLCHMILSIGLHIPTRTGNLSEGLKGHYIKYADITYR